MNTRIEEVCHPTSVPGGVLQVLHVVPTLDPQAGGPTTAILGMVTALAEAGVETVTASTIERREQKCEQPNDRSNHLYFSRKFNAYSYSPALAVWLAQHARDFDLVHTHGLFAHASIAAGQAALRAGIPYVVTPHGMAAKAALARKAMRKRISIAIIERRHLQNATMLHFTSQVEYDDVTALGVQTRRTLIPLGVAPAAIGQAERLLTRIDAPPAPHIGFLGRIHPIKNIEGLIDAFTLVASAYEKSCLLIAGEGDPAYRAALQARVARLGISNRVHWLGFADEQLKADLFAAVRAVALPSHFESFGLAAIEALQSGRPVVMGRAVALAGEATKAGVTETVDVEDPADIARGLRIFLEAAGPTLAERCRAFVSKRYSLSAMGSKLSEMYRTAIVEHA